MYVTQNDWTKARMIAEIQTKMLDHRSTDGDAACLYRAEDGNRCAVGVFIPDSEYQSSFETQSAVALLDSHPALATHMPLSPMGVFSLQCVHDGLSADADPRPFLTDWINSNVVDTEKVLA